MNWYRAIGFRLADRWGPPFAVLKREGLSLWWSGPGTSASKLKDGSVPQSGGCNRIVIEVSDLDLTIEKVEGSGAGFRGKPTKGPGGRQVLVEGPSGNPIERFEPKPEEPSST